MPYDLPEPRWDIVEEHLDEAEFLWGMWEHALVSPKYTLDAVARGPEHRLLAHIDGLVVNGPAVAPRLLVPALERGAPHRVSAAAAALLASPGAAGLDAVLAAWQGPPTRRPALARALACAERPELSPLLRARLGDPALRVAAAELLVARGEPLGDELDRLLASDDPTDRALALRALPDAPDPAAHTDAVLAGLAALEPEVFDAAITAGARLGLAAAWTRARERAQERPGADAALLLALRDDPAAPAVLLAALARSRRRGAAVWALGFLGLPEGLDACLEFLDDHKVGHLVGEAFTAITGVELGADLTAPADPRERLEHTAEDELPRPDPLAVLRWWTRHRGQFVDGQRYLGGAPRSLAGVRSALERGPMRRRPVHLLDLQIHAPAGRARLEPRAPTRRQYAELAVLRGLPLA